MKNPLSSIEQNTLKEFKAAFPTIQTQINDVFVDTIGIFKGTLLHAAVYNRKSSFVRYFLSLGADIESKAGMGHTPLYEAILARSIKIASLLVDAGAVITTRNRLNQNLLSALCTMRYGDRSMTKLKLLDYLLCQGVDPNEKNEYGRTSLFEFVQWNEPLLLKILLDFGVEVDLCDQYGYRPLHVAASRNQDHVCKVLLQQGADKNGANKFAWTPLDMALLFRKETTSHYFKLAGAKATENSTMKLFQAVHDDQEALALEYTLKERNFSLYDAHPLSLLRAAIRSNMNDLVQEILREKGVETEGALGMAAFKGNLAVVQALLDYGVDANERFQNNSALYQVVSLGKLNEEKKKVADLLLAKGCLYDAEEVGLWGRLGDIWQKK